MAATSLNPRPERLAELQDRLFDVLVIGGGITGAAVARDAAARGLSVALVEKHDWGSGTSWRSSKLIHGGLRYLKTGNVKLVFESLAARARLMRLAPHLVRPTDFLFPSYRGRGLAPWELSIGLTAYDLLALGRTPRRHRRLSRQDVLLRDRLLESPNLLSGGLYGDARTDDARLTLENVLDAAAMGAVAVSRVAVEALEKDGKGSLIGVSARETETGGGLSIRARVVVNATGPWGDRLRRLDRPDAAATLRLSRGAHVCVPSSRLSFRDTIAFPMDDGRLLFAIPFGSVTLLGTTDTDHDGLPDGVTATSRDVRYILSAARLTFPAAGLAESDVVATFASLRPLVSQRGRGVGETSREDAIEVSPSGLVTVTGGKLTTHRRMGEKAGDAVVRRLAREGRTFGPSRTRDRPYPGKPEGPMSELVESLRRARDLGKSGPSDETVAHLADRYGCRAQEILALTFENRGLGRPIVEGLPDIDAEVVYAARCEDARSVFDALARRSHIFWQAPGQGEEAMERVAELLGRELHWTPGHRQASLDEYAVEIAGSRLWRREPESHPTI